MKILHLDQNHPLLITSLTSFGFENDEDYSSDKETIEKKIALYDGLIIRSRFRIDKNFLEKATRLQFIGRVGAGLESIDVDYAGQKGIQLFSAPEGNRNAVSEHALGMLLALFNNLISANDEVKKGQWNREKNRGIELDGKVVGLIGYGHMGKAFAKKLKGFEVEVLCYDIKEGVGDQNAKQVPLATLFDKAEVVSLHTPWTPLTDKMVNQKFINNFKNPFWLLNTARGKSVVTKDVVAALKSKKILGAGLDVLEYEKLSFEQLFENQGSMPDAFQELLGMKQVILSPHIAGWTVESKRKLAQTLVDKLRQAQFSTS